MQSHDTDLVVSVKTNKKPSIHCASAPLTVTNVAKGKGKYAES